MNLAHHPERLSPALAEALLAAGFSLEPVTDAAAVIEAEPEGGWALLVVELGEDPTAGLALARRDPL